MASKYLQCVSKVVSEEDWCRRILLGLFMELLCLLLQLLEAPFGIDVDWVLGDLTLREAIVSNAPLS